MIISQAQRKIKREATPGERNLTERNPTRGSPAVLLAVQRRRREKAPMCSGPRTN